MPRLEIPPPGPSLRFDEWTLLVTAELRRFIPAVVAVAKGRHRVIWRYDGHEVTCDNDRESFWIRFGAGPATVSIYDRDRHDAFTARNIAKSVAGHFDAKHSLPD